MRSSPSSSRNAAAASTAAMASKLGVPVSHRRGPRSGAGRTLATGSSSSSAGSTHSTPACGPYHLYGRRGEDVAAERRHVDRRCGARCTASTNTRAPASWAAAMIGARSGTVPRRFDAPGSVTHAVRSSMRSITACGSSVPVAGSNGASTCSAPPVSHARRHGVTLASWSRRVPTTRAPGRNVAATARVKASVNVVMLAPNTIEAADAPRSSATRWRVRSSSASQASAASNAPPALALLPLAAHDVMASIAVSTICVPAGPSNRAHPSRTPGNRSRCMAASVPAGGRGGQCLCHRYVRRPCVTSPTRCVSRASLRASERTSLRSSARRCDGDAASLDAPGRAGAGRAGIDPAGRRRAAGARRRVAGHRRVGRRRRAGAGRQHRRAPSSRCCCGPASSSGAPTVGTGASRRCARRPRARRASSSGGPSASASSTRRWRRWHARDRRAIEAAVAPLQRLTAALTARS